MPEDTSNNLQIELHIPDLNAAQKFYGKLGFDTLWKRSGDDEAGYLVMGREGTIICFYDSTYSQSYFDRFPKSTKRGYGVEIVIPVDNVKLFHEQIQGFADIVDPLAKRPWGVWDFRIQDPFGFYLRMSERHDITNPKHLIPKSKKHPQQ